jgi:hypothetical protein
MRLLFILLLSTSTLFGQKHFAELPDPEAPGDWSSVEKGLHYSFATIDKRFAKSQPPVLPYRTQVNLQAWKGERVSAQVLVWSTESVKEFSLEIGRFEGGSGSFDGGKLRFVRYVMTDEFAGGCGHRKPENFAASLSPDILDEVPSMDIEANTVRPVWLSVEVPRSVSAGNYQASIFYRGEVILRIGLEVVNKTLPEPGNWQYHLDQWQHPSAVARVSGVPLWSEAHFAAMRPVMSLAARAGQKVITATLNKDPWNVQTYDPYADMILWTKAQDGTWSYDYRVFDKWVEFMLDLGIQKMINCYSIIPWNNEIHYKDAQSGKMVNVIAKPGTPIFEELWTPFLRDFVQHLKAKGWLERTSIAIDERTREEVDGALRLLQKVAPQLGIAYADNQKTYQRYPSSRDVSISVGHPYVEADLRSRTAKGLVTTFYICCADGFPNQFTFSDPAESAYLGWYAAATGFNGMLRWAFNSWVENPLQDSRFRTWPAGDTYLVYPEGRSSIRYERMLEGIQDYEKIRLLKEQLSAKDVKILNEAVATLKNGERTPDWNERLNAAKQVVAELSRR